MDLRFLKQTVSMEDILAQIRNSDQYRNFKPLTNDEEDRLYNTPENKVMNETFLLRHIFHNIKGSKYSYYLRYDMPKYGLSDDDFEIFSKRASISHHFNPYQRYPYDWMSDAIYPDDFYLLDLFSKPLPKPKPFWWFKLKLFIERVKGENSHYERWM